ncbi:MAG: hypothetical protein LQ349_006328 [Xanthoria aureola]|nr:MAG: hypothetical protein LQ349_006328 [Xanthoria aureola]
MANGKRTSSGEARIILEAVRFAASANVGAFHQLVARETDLLQLDLVLRILLTYLPESTPPHLYIDLLQQLAHRAVHLPPLPSSPPVQPGNTLSDQDAKHQVRQLHLLPLAEEQDLRAGCTDQISLFLIHRARKIDVETGSIPEVQQLLEPFLDRDPYLRTWMISNILPLRRLDYDYYPQIDDPYTLEAFERLEGRPAVDSLLARSARAGTDEPNQSVRDLRGIVGPWVYGEKSRKRRKTHHDRRRSSMTTPSTNERSAESDEKGRQSAWSDVNEWIVDLALREFTTAADVVEHWDGPNDVDYDGFGDDEELDHDIHGLLVQRYAQAGLATIYVAGSTSTSTIERAHSILKKVARLQGLQEPEEFEKFQNVYTSTLSKDYLDQLSEIHLLPNALLRPENPLTFPENPSLAFASFVLRSCSLLQKLGYSRAYRATAKLAAFGKREEHLEELHKTLQKVPVRTRDNGSWAEVRQQILWLRDWRYESSGKGASDGETLLGVFCRIGRVDVEVELLKALLRASCYTVAVHVYCTRDQHPIPEDMVEKTVLNVAMAFYDGASNGNRTRGGIRKASEILAAFHSHFPESNTFSEANALIAATHSMSFYSLTLQHGVPFQPVNIRASKDPLSLIGRILEQNPRSYTKLDDMIEIGQSLVRAGLEPNETTGGSPIGKSQTVDQSQHQDYSLLESSRRITSMAIEASLSEGDFDTAYSYIVNRLSPPAAGPSKDQSAPQHSPNSRTKDDVSWRSAYLAGRATPAKSSPSHSSVRRLEQRLELLSLALILAPPSELAEILQVWRAVEGDLTNLLAREAAEEDRWNSKGDGSKPSAGSSNLPGGFVPSTADTDQVANRKPRRQSRATAAAANEEAPMGLFDVARGAAQAFSKNAFPLRSAASATKSPVEGVSKARPLSMSSDSGSDGKGERVRKRDMVANAVTGGLASGIGWMIGAPAPPKS